MCLDLSILIFLLIVFVVKGFPPHLPSSLNNIYLNRKGKEVVIVFCQMKNIVKVFLNQNCRKSRNLSSFKGIELFFTDLGISNQFS